MMHDARDLRRALVRSAQALWRTNVQDLADGEVNHKITAIFDDNQWGAWLRERCPEGYTRPPDPDYCGHTVAYVARRVGEHLDPLQCLPVMIDPKIAHQIFPSTYRLSRKDRWAEIGHDAPGYVAPERVAPGDIVVVGKRKAYGDHITLCIYPLERGEFMTIEGNATGEFPDGTRGKGVVRRRRKVSEITRVYRLSASYFIEV